MSTLAAWAPGAAPGGWVSDRDVAALRAYIAQDFERYGRLTSRPGPAGLQPFVSLVEAVFLDVVDLRFEGAAKRPEVIRYVGDVRANSTWLRAEIQPLVAERLIRNALGHGTVDGLDAVDAHWTRLRLLVVLIPQLGLTEAGLTHLLTMARTLADDWLDLATVAPRTRQPLGRRVQRELRTVQRRLERRLLERRLLERRLLERRLRERRLRERRLREQRQRATAPQERAVPEQDRGQQDRPDQGESERDGPEQAGFERAGPERAGPERGEPERDTNDQEGGPGDGRP